MPYKIGTTYGGMVTLASLNIPDPKSSYYEETTRRKLASGKFRGLGPARVLWHWGFLTQAQRDTIRTYMATLSDEVFIESRKNDNSDVFDEFRVYSLWPEENKDTFRRIDIGYWFFVQEIL